MPKDLPEKTDLADGYSLRNWLTACKASLKKDREERALLAKRSWKRWLIGSGVVWGIGALQLICFQDDWWRPVLGVVSIIAGYWLGKEGRRRKEQFQTKEEHFLFRNSIRVVTTFFILSLFYLAYFAPRSFWLRIPLESFYQSELVIPPSCYTWILRSSSDPDQLSDSLYLLGRRKHNSGLKEGIQLLRHKDDYVWLNAAIYIGDLDQKEAVPWLIKSIRHTASKGVDERIESLQRLTNQPFGDEFSIWREWWEAAHPDFSIDWKSGLGYRPRFERAD